MLVPVLLQGAVGFLGLAWLLRDRFPLVLLWVSGTLGWALASAVALLAVGWSFYQNQALFLVGLVTALLMASVLQVGAAAFLKLSVTFAVGFAAAWGVLIFGLAAVILFAQFGPAWLVPSGISMQALDGRADRLPRPRHRSHGRPRRRLGARPGGDAGRLRPCTTSWSRHPPSACGPVPDDPASRGYARSLTQRASGRAEAGARWNALSNVAPAERSVCMIGQSRPIRRSTASLVPEGTRPSRSSRNSHAVRILMTDGRMVGDRNPDLGGGGVPPAEHRTPGVGRIDTVAPVAPGLPELEFVHVRSIGGTGTVRRDCRASVATA